MARHAPTPSPPKPSPRNKRAHRWQARPASTFATSSRSTTSSCATSARRDVQLKILAASAEHNIDHAALADTVNIAEARGGKIYPGNSARRRGHSRSAPGHAASRPATSWSRTATASPTSTASRCASGPTTSPSRSAGTARRPSSATGSSIHAPLDCGLNLWEIAALPLRAPTAYHLWRRASASTA